MRTIYTAILASLFCLFLGWLNPAEAQYMGADSHDSKTAVTTPAQKIGPDTSDATVVTGVNVAGTVRVNNLAMLEALVNIGTNGATIICYLWGISLLWMCIRKVQKNLALRVAVASLPIGIGLVLPGAVQMGLGICRNLNLFS